jgi:hypothetical protein
MDGRDTRFSTIWGGGRLGRFLRSTCFLGGLEFHRSIARVLVINKMRRERGEGENRSGEVGDREGRG